MKGTKKFIFFLALLLGCFGAVIFQQVETTAAEDKSGQEGCVDIGSCKVYGVEKKYEYTGHKIRPEVTVKYRGKLLRRNRDYSVKYTNNKRLGTAVITIKGIGKYKGTVVRRFVVGRASITDYKIKGLRRYYKYKAGGVKPAVIVKGDKTLRKNRDYTVTYKNNNKMGTATIIIKGTGNYKGVIKKSFNIVHQGFETVNGKRYYFKYNGHKQRGFATIDENTYLFSANGVMQTGWRILDGKYYYFDRKNGRRITDDTVDGIKISKAGTVDLSGNNVGKIQTMMKAREIVVDNTLPTDTMEQKRKKVFDWVLQFPYRRYRLLNTIYQKRPDWEITFANDIFYNNSGDCVSEAAAVAFMFHEIGYDNVYLCHDTSHSWVELDGRLYDPLFAEAKEYDENYNAEFTDYRINPVEKIEIY